jgi:hypothetical protein
MSDSRANALKHGLTGTGTVLPASIRSQLEARLEAWSPLYRLDAHPQARHLVKQLVLASIRMEICQDALLDLTPADTAHQLDDSEEIHTQAANIRFESLEKDPVTTVAELRKSSAGCHRLILAWTALRLLLSHPDQLNWSTTHFAHAHNLLGLIADPRTLDPRAASLFVAQNQPDTPEVRADLRAFVDAQITDLTTRATRLATTIESTRKSLLARGVPLDPSPDVKKLQRYEAMATRLFWKTDARLRELNLLVESRPSENRPSENHQLATDNGSSPPFPPGEVAGQRPAGEGLPTPSTATQTLTMTAVEPVRTTPEFRFAPTLQPTPVHLSRHDRRRAAKLQKAAH